ncbi:hypothetical protein [Endozoicomonas sp. SCSIO W0465]|uniref:hypothetical protein n=1 Tax=Endozoicomonas sp. SCSIO W0465 TaxID=2918516 RepID=UPI002075953B|nr:hypothetical protein [Endozoicomonas sp. SCSIO W0465]USE37798.1 hypothetical protein MJO57_06290 [Endozoicomonas sp. SCSIO W0465]
MITTLNKITTPIFALIMATSPTVIRAQPAESWYQQVWCEGMDGKIEHRLPDGRRIDCLTDQYAIEIEFARKWQEAIGQSLNYSMLTGKKAGIVLVLKATEDQTHWQQLLTVIEHYTLPIKVWKLGP